MVSVCAKLWVIPDSLQNIKQKLIIKNQQKLYIFNKIQVEYCFAASK